MHDTLAPTPSWQEHCLSQPTAAKDDDVRLLPPVYSTWIPPYGSAKTPTTGRSWEPLLLSCAACLTRSTASFVGRNTESRKSKPSSRSTNPTAVQSLRHCTRRTARRVDRLCSQRECPTCGSCDNEAMVISLEGACP